MASILKHFLLDYKFKNNMPNYRVAMKMGISEVKLSKMLNGLVEPSVDEKVALATILDRRVSELFPTDKSKKYVYG